MTTPDPNDPYKVPPPGAGQNSGGAPGYPRSSGMPAAAPYAGGPPPAPTVIPGKTKTARVLIFVAGGLLALISLLNLVAVLGDPDEFEKQAKDAAGAEVASGVYATLFVIFLIYAAAGIFLATRFGNGGNGVRVGALSWAGVGIVVAVLSLPLGVVTLVLSILTIVFLANAESVAWFKRPR